MKEEKTDWALLIANHGRTYLVEINEDEIRVCWPLQPSADPYPVERVLPYPPHRIRVCDALEIWSNLIPTPDGGLAKGTFNTLFEQCVHPAPVTFFSPSAFVWLRDMHEDDRKGYEEYIAQNKKDRAAVRARRVGIELSPNKPHGVR